MAADLEDVLERVCHFVPFVNKVLVSFAHDEIEVLIGLARHEDVVQDSLLVVCKCPPSITMQCLE